MKSPNPRGNRALQYLRISGSTGTDFSPDTQARLNQTIIAQIGCVCDARPGEQGGDVYADTEKGLHSARKRDNLRGWERLIERARADNSVRYIVAATLDRAFRNTSAFLGAVRQLKEIGVELHLGALGVIDLDSPTGFMSATFSAVVAEAESVNASFRLKRSYENLRGKGVYLGRHHPFGLFRRGHTDQVTLEPNPDELPVLLEILRLYAQGDDGVPEIVRRMNAAGWKWRNNQGGRVPLKTTTIRKFILRLEMYERFMPPDLYVRALRVRSARGARRENGARFVHPRQLLWRVVVCADCGERAVSCGANARHGASYLHSMNSDCQTWANVAAKFIDSAVLDWLDAHFRIDEDAIESALAEYAATPKPQALDITQRRDKLTERLRGYEQMRADGDITRATFLERKAEIEQALAELVPPPTRAKLPVDELRAFLASAQLIRRIAEQDAARGNAILRELFERVEIRGRVVTRLVVRAEYAGFTRVPR